MPISKIRIDFDPTSVDDLDRIGAHLLGLRGGNSQPIDSRDNSGVEELYVHDVDANSELDDITALLTTIDADTAAILLEVEALSHAEDSAAGSGDMGLMALAVRNDSEGSLVDTDGDYGALQLDAVGRLRVIADIDLSSNVADDDESTENPILTGGVAHDAASALGALSDDGDKMHILGDLYRRQFVNDAFNIALKNTAAVVGTDAAEVAAAPLAGRLAVEIANFGDKTVYVGFDNTVTVANGYPIPKNASMYLRAGEPVDIWMISGTAAQDVRLLEAA